MQTINSLCEHKNTAVFILLEGTPELKTGLQYTNTLTHSHTGFKHWQIQRFSQTLAPCVSRDRVWVGVRGQDMKNTELNATKFLYSISSFCSLTLVNIHTNISEYYAELLYQTLNYRKLTVSETASVQSKLWKCFTDHRWRKVKCDLKYNSEEQQLSPRTFLALLFKDMISLMVRGWDGKGDLQHRSIGHKVLFVAVPNLGCDGLGYHALHGPRIKKTLCNQTSSAAASDGEGAFLFGFWWFQ